MDETRGTSYQNGYGYPPPYSATAPPLSPPPLYQDNSTNYGPFATGQTTTINYPRNNHMPYGYPIRQMPIYGTIEEQQRYTALRSTNVPDNMHLAAFSCLCCFWPLGLVAVIKSLKSRDAAARGDFQLAVKQANDSRLFSQLAVAIGLFIFVVAAIAITFKMVVTRTDSW